MSEKKEQQASEEEEEQDDKNEETSEEEQEEEDVDWKERALKAERAIIAAKQKEKDSKPESEGDDELREKVNELSRAEEKRQFGYKHDLSPEEVDKVFSINSDPSEETLEDPFVKAGLQAIRKEKRVDENTPSSSAKQAPTSKKDFKDLSKQEKNAEWQKYMKEKGVIG